MSLVWLTDIKTQQKVAINPKFVIAAFTAVGGDSDLEKEIEGKTVVGLVNGNIVVEEELLDVVTSINGAE